MVAFKIEVSENLVEVRTEETSHASPLRLC